MQGVCARSLCKLFIKSLSARSLYKLSFGGLLARSLSEISTQDLCKRSLCKISAQCLWKRSFRKISVRDLLDLDSWQDLFAFSLSKSLRRISWTESALCHSKSDPTRTSQRLGKPWKTHGRHGAKGAANFLRLLLKPHFSCDFHDYMTICDFWVAGLMRSVYLSARSAQHVQKEKHHFFFTFSFSCLFHTFFWPFSLLSQKKQNTLKLWRGLATFFLDLRPSDTACDFCHSHNFSLRLGFLGMQNIAKQRTSCICH